MASQPTTSHPFIASWTSTPIPNLTLSASGLLALADLHTIAVRTALTGGSTWLDALVLAPGLHYQQAAEALDRELYPDQQSSSNSPLSAVETGRAENKSDERRHGVNNTALVHYLRRLGKDDTAIGEVVTLDVARDSDGEHMGRRLSGLVSPQSNKRRRRVLTGRALPSIDWPSQLLYLASPLLTIAALVLTTLLKDWWALAFILALMLSRVLNITCIKNRCNAPHDDDPPDDDTRSAEYHVELSPGHSVLLRGLASDLQAITTQAWMRARSRRDGYLEAAAKLIVYLVAASSGNLTQAGGIVLMALLLLSAGLLGLSNGHSRSFRMHGRVASPCGQGRKGVLS